MSTIEAIYDHCVQYLNYANSEVGNLSSNVRKDGNTRWLMGPLQSNRKLIEIIDSNGLVWVVVIAFFGHSLLLSVVQKSVLSSLLISSTITFLASSPFV